MAPSRPSPARVLLIVEDRRAHQEIAVRALTPLAQKYNLEFQIAEDFRAFEDFLNANPLDLIALVVSDGNLGMGPDGLAVLATLVNRKFQGLFCLWATVPNLVDAARKRGWPAFDKNADGIGAVVAWADAKLASSRPPRSK